MTREGLYLAIFSVEGELEGHGGVTEALLSDIRKDLDWTRWYDKGERYIYNRSPRPSSRKWHKINQRDQLHASSRLLLSYLCGT